MKILLGLVLFALSTIVASADCPDIDNDGHPESCFQEDVLIPSEDNCPTVYNPDQKYPLRFVHDGTLHLWVVDKSGLGVKCNYDMNGDGLVTFIDLHIHLAQTRKDVFVMGIWSDQVNKIGDFDGDGVYVVPGAPIGSNAQIRDFCQMENHILSLGIYIPFTNCD